MQTLHWFILGGLVLAILVVLKTLLASPDPGKQPCTCAPTFCTRHGASFGRPCKGGGPGLLGPAPCPPGRPAGRSRKGAAPWKSGCAGAGWISPSFIRGI